MDKLKHIKKSEVLSPEQHWCSRPVMGDELKGYKAEQRRTQEGILAM